MRRASRSDWLPLILILALIGISSGLAAKAIYRRLTLATLSGIWRAWYAAYNGTSYYAVWSAAQSALAPIASTIARGAQQAAGNELDAWLKVYDPLGIVRARIEDDQIDEDGINYFEPVPP